jgi:hypothetical protein
VSVPLSCTVHYREDDITNSSAAAETTTTTSSSKLAALRRLQAGVPTASDGSHGAWQFKMALQVTHNTFRP